METKTKNCDIWNFSVNLRYNITLTIGTIFILLDPHPVEKLMEGDIPIFISRLKDVILKSPSTYLLVSIDSQIQVNTEFAFFFTGENLTLTSFAPLATS